jgi:ParB-like chromosome segregation protein Spo0J
MLELRPLVIDENNIVLGGNMRLRACIEAGLLDVPVIQVMTLTKEQKEEFVIKDNLAYGEWDWDNLANEWSVSALVDWGLDLPTFDKEVPEPKDETNVKEPITCPNCGFNL